MAKFLRKNSYSLGIAIFLGVFAPSCAHRSATESSSSIESEAADKAKDPELQSFRTSDPQQEPIVDQELETIPTDYNERVEQWLTYFQGKGRGHMERYLSRMPRYGGIMKKILRDNGLPEDLIYIALIESGFSLRATSRMAAVGFWQFIRGTAKRYGLQINALVDERRDPILSTQAAAEYFKGLYSVFGSWYLAMASYNLGENRIKREIMKHMTRDFWALARIRRFPRETKNYIPKFIAAKLIAKDPAKYGFKDLETEKPIEFELIKVSKPINLRVLASKLNFDYDDFKEMNPKFKGEIAPLKVVEGKEFLEVRVPLGTTTQALAFAEESAVEKVELVADAGDTFTYRVRRGDSLFTIARRHHTNVTVLQDINDLKPGRKLRIGMHLQIPEPGSRKRKHKVAARNESVKVTSADIETGSSQAAVEETTIRTREGRIYLVARGDTLSSIADENNCTVTELRRLNGLKRRAILKAGMKLKLPTTDEGMPSSPDEKSQSRSPQSVVPISHRVRSRETLLAIARKYGVSAAILRRANRLHSDHIEEGEVLLVPKKILRTTGKINGRPRLATRSHRNEPNLYVKSLKRSLAEKKGTRANFYHETARAKGNETIE